MRLLVVEKEIEQSQEHDDGTEADAKMHRPCVWEAEEPGRSDQPNTHEDVEPFLPVPISDHGSERKHADDRAGHPQVDLALTVRQLEQPRRYEEHGREKQIVEVGDGFAFLPMFHETPLPKVCRGNCSKASLVPVEAYAVG